MSALEKTDTSFWQSHPNYHGALRSCDGWRLVISPNGKRYSLQRRCVHPEDGEIFVVTSWRKQLSALVDDLPQEIVAQGLDDLPDDPNKFVRPWSAAMQSQGDRVRRARLDHDTYAGVIWSDGSVRLVISPCGAKYVLQTGVSNGGAGKVWKYLKTSVKTGPILALVNAFMTDCPKASLVAQNLGLMSTLVRLPERATFYQGPKPERLTEAVKVPSQGSANKRATSPLRGPVRRS